MLPMHWQLPSPTFTTGTFPVTIWSEANIRMIARIEGIVIEKDAGYLVILVGGIGVELLVTRVAHESAHIDERVSLLTRLIVREDALTLYGFATEQERNLFDTIIKISGVGPKLAITILSTLSADN